MTTRPRFSGVTALAGAVLVLLPALAWLQYSWLDQIADADRERRARSLQTAASRLAQDLDAEVGKAVFNLQLDPAIVEQQNWLAYAERYQRWLDGALTPEIVQSVYFVDADDDRPAGVEPVLRIWSATGHQFETTAWPAELAPIQKRFQHDARRMVDWQVATPRRGERGRTTQRMILPPAAAGDPQSIVLPVMRVTADPSAEGAGPAPPKVRLLGFTIIRLDLGTLGRQLLPQLVRRHLYDDEGESDFLVAVLSRETPPQVVFESEAGAARIAAATPDLSTPLLGPRLGSLFLMTRDGRRGGPPGRDPGALVYRDPPPMPPLPADTEPRVVVDVIEERRGGDGRALQARAFGGGEAHWQLVATHRSGSLQAAVASARTRNFLLSSGILLLLTTAIGLIVVAARRADRLARQQLEFVGAVSHELRTPVSVIGAAAGNLADGVVEEPGRVKKYGATIQTEARRLAETVERVLQLAGIAAMRSAPPTVISGHTLINDALSAVRHDIETAGITVDRDLPENLPAVAGDAIALRSALQNLIGNAVKYAGDARWVRVAAEGGDHLRITVEDHGLGISAEDRKHIFEPFYRGREAVSRQIQGSGLGLHLVRRIIEAHGGTVSVRSDPGRGSTFIMELPVAGDGAATPSLALSTTASR